MSKEIETRLQGLLAVLETRELTNEERAEMDELKNQVSDLEGRVGAIEAEEGTAADTVEDSTESTTAEPAVAQTRSAEIVETPKVIAPVKRAVPAGAPRFVRDMNDATKTRTHELALRGWFLAPFGEATDEMKKAANEVRMDLSNRFMKLNLRSNPKETRGTSPQATTPGAAGGFLVPTELLVSAFEKYMLYTANLRNYATVLRTTAGHPINIPTVDDTAVKGSIVAENTAKTVSDVTFGQKTLKAFKYTSGIVLVSMELLQDSAVNLPTLLAELLAERIARIQADHFMLGAGTTEPQGIGTGATSAGSTAGAGAITVDDMLGLRNSVDLAYRSNGAFIVSDATLAALQKLRFATSGEPVFVTDYRDVMAPTRLFGHPVIVDNALPAATTTGGIAAIFGDLSKYYIRDAMSLELKRSDERYFEYNQSAFLAEMRTDAAVINTAAIKKLLWK